MTVELPLVLLVDDDADVLRGLSRALHRQPYRIFTARSAAEALGVLKTRYVHVVVADERMPGMPGIDLLRWIAENCPDVTRIMLTGNATTQTAMRAINDAGVYRFFTKPCDVVQLAMAIRTALDARVLS